MPFLAVLFPHRTPKARLFGTPGTGFSIVAYLLSHHLRPTLAPPSYKLHLCTWKTYCSLIMEAFLCIRLPESSSGFLVM